MPLNVILKYLLIALRKDILRNPRFAELSLPRLTQWSAWYQSFNSSYLKLNSTLFYFQRSKNQASTTPQSASSKSTRRVTQCLTDSYQRCKRGYPEGFFDEFKDGELAYRDCVYDGSLLGKKEYRTNKHFEDPGSSVVRGKATKVSYFKATNKTVTQW